MGFSNGGNTVIQIAVRYPKLVNKLILASTFYQREGLPISLFEGMQQATLTDMPVVLRNAFLEITPDNNKLLTMFNKDRERMLNFIDWTDEMLQAIKAPTLIMVGDRDVISPEHTVKMSRQIPNSRLLILPAAHGAYIGVAESPQANNKVIEFVTTMIHQFLNDDHF